MPNHCGNLLIIKGKAVLLKEFESFARGKGPVWDGKADDREKLLDLNKFVPIPPEVINAKKNNSSDAFNSGGYEWCVSNWGTKWGVYDITVTNVNATTLQYQFLTAWAPFNQSVLMAMSERFPELEFELKYAECGMGFAGIMTASGGEADDRYAEDGSRLAKKDEDIEMLMGISG